MFGLFKKPRPVNPIREALFGDMPLEQWAGANTPSSLPPWNLFAQSREALAAGNLPDAIAAWRTVVATPSLEARHYLQAWHFLRAHGVQPPIESAKEVLGVVVEVSLPGGLDLLAAYADRSARYFNYSGRAVIWEHPNELHDPAIDALLAAARSVVPNIGPWDGPRPPAPAGKDARVNFLTPSGLHFGQGPMRVLQGDPMAAPVLSAATRLMLELIQTPAPR